MAGYGILGGLPPGARGFLAGEQSQQQNTANQITQMGGILGLQNAMVEQQLMPLKVAQLQLAIQKAAQQQAALSRVAGGPAQGALAQGAASGDIGPTVTNAARIPQVADQDHLSLLAAGVDAKTVNAIRDIQTPKMEVNQGYAFNPRGVPQGFLPGVNISQTGQAVGLVPSQGGGLPSVQALPGSLSTFSAFRGAEEAAKAPYQPPIETLDAQGRRVFTPRPTYAAPFVGGQPGTPAAGAPAPSAPSGVGPTEAESSFSRELAQRQATALLEGQKAAEDSVQIINTVREGRKILDSGIITGFGADFRTGMGMALQSAGIDYGGDAPANTQAFVSNMANNVGRVIKQFGSGTGLSDADREYASKIAGGSVNLDERAIRRIFDIQEKQARWVIRNHNTKSKGIRSQVPLSVEEPSEWSIRPAR